MIANTEQGKSQNSTGDESTFNPDYSQNKQLIEEHDVPESPFTITGNPESGFHVKIGLYRITENKRTIEECQMLIDNKDWWLIIGLIGATIGADKHIMVEQMLQIERMKKGQEQTTETK